MLASGYYVYAITSNGARLPDGVVGLEQAELSVVVRRDLAAVVSLTSARQIQPEVELVVLHEAVVEAVRREGPGLPVRFGTVLADVAAIEHALDHQHEVLAADLARIGDKVELGLSVLWPEPSVEAEPGEVDESASTALSTAEGHGSGARYLQRRVAEYRRDAARRGRGEEIVRGLDCALGCQALDRRSTILPTPGLAVRAAYLVDPSRVGAFRRAFDEVRRAQPELRVLLSGPWPPYSFVTRAVDGDGQTIADRASDASTPGV